MKSTRLVEQCLVIQKISTNNFKDINKLDIVLFLKSNILFQQITSLGGVPSVLTALSKSTIVNEYDLSSLKFVSSGAAALSPEVQKNTQDKMNVQVAQGIYSKSNKRAKNNE